MWIPQAAAAPLPLDDTLEPSARSGLRVLLVDDEPLVLRAAKLVLTQAGHEVVEFQSSPDALAAFRDAPETFDLAVLDCQMPMLGGPEMTREIRAVHPDFPVIFLTGNVTAHIRRTAQAVDVQVILDKPFTSQELLNAIQRALDPLSKDDR